MTLNELETALFNNRLEIQGHSKKWYRIRRNGKTKRWARLQNKFVIPCKIGFRECFYITDDKTIMVNAINISNPLLRINND